MKTSPAKVMASVLRKRVKLDVMCYEIGARSQAINDEDNDFGGELLGWVENEVKGRKCWRLYIDVDPSSRWKHVSEIAGVDLTFSSPNAAAVMLAGVYGLKPTQLRNPRPARYVVRLGRTDIGWLESYDPDGWTWLLYSRDDGDDGRASEEENCPFAHTANHAMRQLLAWYAQRETAPKETP